MQISMGTVAAYQPKIKNEWSFKLKFVEKIDEKAGNYQSFRSRSPTYINIYIFLEPAFVIISVPALRGFRFLLRNITYTAAAYMINRSVLTVFLNFTRRN